MIIHTDPQGSEEWKQRRAGVITASMFSVARAKLKRSGEPTNEAKNYAFRLAVERISGLPMDEGFETWAMRRGRELEPEARAAHEIHAGVTVKEAGFITTDCGLYGATADGLIGEDGGAEYKCLVSPERVRDALLDNDISEFLDQVQGGMWITGRKWWDFCIYCPALDGVNRMLTRWRIQRDDEYITTLETELQEFNAMVQTYMHKLENNK